MQRLTKRAARPHAFYFSMKRASFKLSWALVLGALIPSLAQAQAVSKSQFERGAQLYEQNCALCHGAEGRGGQGFAGPIWGAGHDITKFGSARGLFEYVQLFMPFDNPQKITDEEQLSVIAFMLIRNGSLARDQALELSKAAATLIK